MKTTVFISSSKNQIKLARAIRQRLRRYAKCEVWDEVAWTQGKSTLENLLSFTHRYDFAVFVLAPDDLSNVNGKPSWKPRDNVVFEYGLFMGELGPKRCFLVAPWGQEDFHLPTDLAGIYHPAYSPVEFEREGQDLLEVVSSACREVGRVIQDSGPRFGSMAFIVNKKSRLCMEILGSQYDWDDVPIQLHRILNRVHPGVGLARNARRQISNY
jgi:predicted nucleotide-binding protein